MKKIDLHIHTVTTFSDRAFVFSLDTFKRYVAEAKLDVVAITNHDLFDKAQFIEIQKTVTALALPGIEINVEKGHLLVIADPAELDEFTTKTAQVTRRISKVGDSISVEVLLGIFGDLNKYIVIPHYDKGPSIAGITLEKLRPFICAGEVDSAKKFVRNAKDPFKLPPVLFSDSRMMVGLTTWPTRQTFIDCGETTFDALKACLRDKGKAALSEKDGNRLWQVFDNGQMLSTGLNILIGPRSTGKTYFLNRIKDAIKGVKYIEQFSLVQQNEATYEREFKTSIERRRSAFVDAYLGSFKTVLDEVRKVDCAANERQVEKYLETLLKSAEEADRRDAFSNTALFDEQEFPTGNTKTLQDLVSSVRQVAENIEYRPVIEKHVDLSGLRRLACELIEILRAKTLEINEKRVVNELVKEIKKVLKFRTAAVQIEDIDLYNVAMDAKKVERFSQIVEFLKTDSVIFQETIQGFKIEARKSSYPGAMEVKTASGTKFAFSEAFQHYDIPYDYLRKLSEIDGLATADYYKLFARIRYRILNKDGHEVSGGERSEFRLLQEIADAQNYDLLLLDEPESSFDNLFLKSEVNQILKSIAQTMPVIVVTHNNTVGASAGADYLVHTAKSLEGGVVKYSVYSGYPSDKKLRSIDGDEIDNYKTQIDSLEAGQDAYETRRKSYETIKDR